MSISPFPYFCFKTNSRYIFLKFIQQTRELKIYLGIPGYVNIKFSFKKKIAAPDFFIIYSYRKYKDSKKKPL